MLVAKLCHHNIKRANCESRPELKDILAGIDQSLKIIFWNLLSSSILYYIFIFPNRTYKPCLNLSLYPFFCLFNLKFCFYRLKILIMISPSKPKLSFWLTTLMIFALSLNAFPQAVDSTKKVSGYVPKSYSTTNFVIDSIKLEGDTSKNGKIKPLRADFNKRIVIYVSGPTGLFENQSNDAIYINNIRMPYDVNFNCPCVNAKDTTIKYFTLTCSLAKQDSVWNKWYGFKDNYLGVRVDIGIKDRQYTCTGNNNLSIKMFDRSGLVWASAFAIILLIVSVLLAFVFKTNLIKDKSSQPDKKPYSLSRFQLLWWTVIIISCYILLFAIRDDFALLSQSTLILLGISVAGTSFAAVVDYRQSDQDRHQDQPGVNFIQDVLSDDEGISVHRYQNLIFTFIFGIIFFYKVLATGNMPNFGPLELSLMGLSTAAYVGLKTSENKTSSTATPTSTPTPAGGGSATNTDSSQNIVG
jgi:hypothetical protein